MCVDVLDQLADTHNQLLDAMASFLVHRANTKVTIPSIEEGDGFTMYNIVVEVGPVTWSVSHRFKDFVELHDQLVSDHGVTKDILPPKKVIGNRDPVFVEKRRLALEIYLATVVSFLQQTMPRILATFLDFHQYDILFILQDMAAKFFHEGDELLRVSREYDFTPLELHAISERLKQPCPPREMIDTKFDFSHVLDFCCQLSTVCVHGGWAPVGTSNITPNQLLFEMSSFKAVEKLCVFELPVANIYSAGCLRDTVVSLAVHYAHVKHISHILLCDDIHKDSSSKCEAHMWKKVVEADFSHNDITAIDEAIKLMPNIEKLFLNSNSLSAIDNLTSLPHLSHIHLSANLFKDVDNFHTKIGNIVHIDLSQNMITSLEGFSKLYSLEGLDLGSNQISDLEEVKHIKCLPCLESLVLTGNPVAIVVDYRIKVLEQFGKRACHICLDNEKSTQKELDTVAVLQALRIVREGKVPNLNSP